MVELRGIAERNAVQEARRAIEQGVRDALAVGSATTGQNLAFGSGGFEWVTPAGTAGGVELFTVRKIASLRV